MLTQHKSKGPRLFPLIHAVMGVQHMTGFVACLVYLGGHAASNRSISQRHRSQRRILCPALYYRIPLFLVFPYRRDLPLDQGLETKARFLHPRGIQEEQPHFIWILFGVTVHYRAITVNHNLPMGSAGRKPVCGDGRPPSLGMGHSRLPRSR